MQSPQLRGRLAHPTDGQNWQRVIVAAGVALAAVVVAASAIYPVALLMLALSMQRAGR